MRFFTDLTSVRQLYYTPISMIDSAAFSDTALRRRGRRGVQYTAGLQKGELLGSLMVYAVITGIVLDPGSHSSCRHCSNREGNDFGAVVPAH